MAASLERPSPLAVGLCVLACLTMFTYAIATSAAQSLLLSAYGAPGLPWAWACVALVSVAVTSAIATLSERLDIVRLFGLGCRLSGASLAALLAVAYVWPQVGAFGLYVWKDIYIIILVELFWTFANVVFGVRSASHLYGYFCAAGSLGSVLGNVALSHSARLLGTWGSLWLILPLLLAIASGCHRLARDVPVPAPRGRPEGARLGHGVGVLRHSRVLPALLGVVALAQAWLTLIDFRFSHFMAPISELERTALIANVYALINAASFGLQLATGLVLGAVGGAVALSVLPVCALLCLGWLSEAPSGLLPVCAMLVVGKSLDYSLFRATKEMLYIPLSYAEKTTGKAIIDILVYRVAKGAVSALLLLSVAEHASARAQLWPLWLTWAAWLLAISGLLWRLRAVPGYRDFRFRWPRWPARR